MAKAIVTTHARRHADHEALTAEQAAEADRRRALGAWSQTLGRPLTHAIRYTLNVNLPRDVAWIETCRDTRGEELLAILWHLQAALTPADWADLRQQREHVHRVLLKRRQLGTPRNAPIPDGRLTDEQAQSYAAAFGRWSPVCAS